MGFLTNNQISEYFQRSYKASDGLWFMKTEEKYGFESALEIDKEVWKVLPKIQARMMKSMLKIGEDKNALLESLKSKLIIEGFKFKIIMTEKGFQILINDCPWLNLMIKSGREKYSGKIGEKICNIEYSVWANEFEKNTQFKLATQKCKNKKHCTLDFKNR